MLPICSARLTGAPLNRLADATPITDDEAEPKADVERFLEGPPPDQPS